MMFNIKTRFVGFPDPWASLGGMEKCASIKHVRFSPNSMGLSTRTLFVLSHAINRAYEGCSPAFFFFFILQIECRIWAQRSVPGVTRAVVCHWLQPSLPIYYIGYRDRECYRLKYQIVDHVCPGVSRTCTRGNRISLSSS